MSRGNTLRDHAVSGLVAVRSKSIAIGGLLLGVAMVVSPSVQAASEVASSPVQECGNAGNTLEINACLQKQQEKTEAKLNQVYREVLAQISTDSTLPDSPDGIKQQFINAQRAWIRFREKDCQAIYTFWSQGTIRNAMYLGCMRSRAEQRIKELQEYTQP